MDTISAFAYGDATRHKELMVFDWDKAAHIIKDLNIKNARAGLAGDWEYTGDYILINGEIPKDSYTFLASTWATPELEIDGKLIDCYKMQKEVSEWGSKTFWPESAIKILKA